MKICPVCSRSYEDSLAFCLADGTPLANESETETVVMNAPVKRKKGKFLLWIGLILLFVVIGIASFAGLIIYKLNRQSNAVQTKTPGNILPKMSPTLNPATSAATTAKSEIVSPTESATTNIESSTAKSEEKDDGDLTPIGWDTTASGFKGEAGQIYKFRCPEQGTEHTVYGSDVYTQDSSICTAAVHAGIITLAQGGNVTLEYRPGRQIYGSTVRNGIKSNTWGEYPRSFVVR